MIEKEFDYTTKEGYTFEGWVTKGKWLLDNEDRYDFEFGFITDPKGKIIDQDLKKLEVDIVNLSAFSEAFEYLTSEEFWNE